MKTFRKSMVALLTLVCLAASLLPASAAQSGNYSIKVEGGTVRFIRGGKAAKYTVLQPVELILRTDKDGELIVVIRTESGYRNITLGSQKAVDISGNLGKLYLGSSLDPKISVQTGEQSQIQNLYVRGAGNVVAAGKLQNVEVSGAANVTFPENAAVQTLTVTNMRAAVTAKTGSAIEQTFAPAGTSLSGVSSVRPLPLGMGTSDASPTPEPDRSPNNKEMTEIPSESPEIPSEAPGGQSNEISIAGVYPSRGAVQVKLSRPVALDPSAFYISCPTGKDMTILRVSTSDDQTYNLTTAMYADNTYQMEITLPDGSLITRKFTTSGGVPQIKSAVVSRISETQLQFTYSADDFGILYYMAVPGATRRSAIGTTAPSTAEELVRNGASSRIRQYSNTVTIQDLAPSTPYTLYYAVGDEDRNTPVMQPELSVPAEPPMGPPVSSITITAENVSDDHFRVTLSKATGDPLVLSNFSATCPGDTITLGRVETKDNKVYEVYLASGDHLLSNNTIKVTVTFPDGTAATDSYYCDNFGPVFTAIKANWASASDSSSVILRVSSDESGILYYITAVSEDNKPAPDKIAASGYTKNLSAGINEWTLDQGIQANHNIVYFVAKDRYGNLSSFTNSAEIGQAQQPDQPAANEIESITRLPNASSPACTRINVHLKEPVTSQDLYPSNFKIIVLNATTDYEPRVWGIEPGIGPATDITVQFNDILPDGIYRLELSTSGGVLKKEFSISN